MRNRIESVKLLQTQFILTKIDNDVETEQTEEKNTHSIHIRNMWSLTTKPFENISDGDHFIQFADSICVIDKCSVFYKKSSIGSR